MPGMQKPHCTAPYLMKASCSGVNSPAGARPSIVVTSLPSASTARIRQELNDRPLIKTVQAPHSPTVQHSLVPVRPNSSRRTSSRNLDTGTFSIFFSPLTIISTAISSGIRATLNQATSSDLKDSTAHDQQHCFPILQCRPQISNGRRVAG